MTVPPSPRLDYLTVLPDAPRALLEAEKVVRRSTLEPLLLELIKVRASQINGCAFCVDMHTKDAVALGEDQRRLHLVAVWREAPVYSERERAALGWCEALTLLAQTGAPDDVYATVEAAFTAEERVVLTLAVGLINTWNRLSVGFRRPAGDYVSRRRAP